MLLDLIHPIPHLYLILVPAILLSLIVDQVFGEPVAALHPVVWMGYYLHHCGLFLAPKTDQRSQRPAINFVAGVIAILLPMLLLGWFAWYLQNSISLFAWYWQALILGCLLKPCLSWRMLLDEVRAVEAALRLSLDAGRNQLARLVSRDVRSLEAHQVRESAIETLAENLNDSVISPLFWFALLGLPGALMYRFANTADAMWGYRGERAGRIWTWFGKCSARTDDVLSWPGARITALLMYVALWRCPDSRLMKEAGATTSPNGGWPMGAMALLLDVRLSKPEVYVLHANGAQVESHHTEKALEICQRIVWLIALACLGVAIVVLSFAKNSGAYDV
ncbi:adenosylcobinamide-phosphate synthase CbiB [Undibacterium flavidum]|uniref:Cobalamin biosynthesis protein CobD n=1 Tax=Undibacterium flavidum TaxID=2762297 RepID=A0ABR6YD33_9BURK|nr:adenosylcobinamide-phosphate synthase CbiB [Undibacterium flavidum]MBC3874451.1 cobalamin biosynthesis protein CobD [Undibacterium flavidum]